LPEAEPWPEPPVAIADLASPAPSASDHREEIISWRMLLALVASLHAGFVLVLLARLLVGQLALQRWWARARPAPDETEQLFRSLAQQIGVPAARLRLSAQVSGPLCFGIAFPRVLLPASWESASESSLIWTFTHELSHLRRRDPGLNGLWALMQALYGIWPWTWQLVHAARLAQEYLADAEAAGAAEQASAGAVDVEDYAAFLVRLAAGRGAPVGAAMVQARPSDLFRRISMLTQNARTIENTVPRRWRLFSVTGLLGLTLILGGLQPRLGAVPADKDAGGGAAKEPGKEARPQANKPAPKDAVEDPFDPAEIQKQMRDLFEKIQPNGPQDFGPLFKQMEEMQQAHRRMFEQMHRQLGRGLPAQGAFMDPLRLPLHNGFAPRARQGYERLGVRVEPPSELVMEQLDLPVGQGLVIAEVVADSAAAKAGFKKNDILVELAGKKVSSHVSDLQKQLQEIKANEATEAVVVRKGVPQVIQGLKLAEARVEREARDGFPALPRPLARFAGGNAPVGGSVRVNVNNDSFTIRQTQGEQNITIEGRLVDGKAQPSEIVIVDGDSRHRANSLEQVPAAYRTQVQQLLQSIR
jgi:beta-lactamase regulating signal transducer with metallopeptidase domain